jgi:two-component sensor histidine kinase
VLTIGEQAGGRTEAGWLYVDEVTHRALNDFTIMSALVRRASSKLTDAAARREMEGVMIHLHAAAKTLQALRPPRAPSHRNLCDDLEELCAALSAAILTQKAIRLTLAADRAVVSAGQSWKICLIVAELVMNAARHAFQSAAEGEIRVDLSVRDGALRCAVVDNGSAATVIAAGRGSSILDAIASELGGVITRTHSDHGSAVILHIPLSAPIE